MPAVSLAERSSGPLVPGSSAWWRELAGRLDRRRPRADGLTIERIVEEAVALVDAEGLEALTVRGLASRFGTGSATLYRHVASRDELLVLIVDHVLGEVEPPGDDLTGRPRVEALAAELRRVLLRHPNLVPALPAAPLLGPNALRGSELALVALLESGLEVDVAVPAYLALLDFVLGSVFFDSGRLGRHGEPAEVDAEDDLQGTRSVIESLTSDDVFAFGLARFLDGVGRRSTP